MSSFSSLNSFSHLLNSIEIIPPNLINVVAAYGRMTNITYDKSSLTFNWTNDPLKPEPTYSQITIWEVDYSASTGTIRNTTPTSCVITLGLSKNNLITLIRGHKYLFIIETTSQISSGYILSF